MNNQQFTILRKKIEKFDRLANVVLWHNNVRLRIGHRFSIRNSGLDFAIRNIEISFPKDVFVLASNNDVLLITTRPPHEVEEWKLSPTNIYDKVVGDESIFALDWGEIVELPKSLVEPVLDIFKTYYRVSIVFATVTVAVALRIPVEHNGKTVFAPNPSLFPQEQDWVINMQVLKAEGREIPPRPEILLGERLQKAGLWDGLEWGGLE